MKSKYARQSLNHNAMIQTKQHEPSSKTPADPRLTLVGPVSVVSGEAPGSERAICVVYDRLDLVELLALVESLHDRRREGPSALFLFAASDPLWSRDPFSPSPFDYPLHVAVRRETGEACIFRMLRSVMIFS
jgi:hypothetical protein